MVNNFIPVHLLHDYLMIVDLGPRDDLESLAYTAFFLLRDDLPWRKSTTNESTKNSMRRIRASKAAESGNTLGSGLPAEFGYLLDYSRLLPYDQLPDYEELRRRFTDLEKRVVNGDSNSPLDWSTVGTAKVYSNSEIASSTDDSESGSDSEDNEDGGEECFSNSYFEWDIGDWDIQGARDRDLTLPAEQVELIEGNIAQIVEVIQD